MEAARGNICGSYSSPLSRRYTWPSPPPALLPISALGAAGREVGCALQRDPDVFDRFGPYFLDDRRDFGVVYMDAYAPEPEADPP